MVTVIITTFGANTLLIRAIESVLRQTYVSIEIIVVDDNNPDSQARKQTEIMMARYLYNERVHYIKHSKNQNGATARNTGIAIAQGEYIGFLDDDDYYLPDKIKSSVQYLENNPDVVGVCQEVIRVKNGYIVDVMQVEDGYTLVPDDLLVSPVGIGSGSNIFLKKTIVNEAKGFDVAFKRKQDIEFMLRIIKLGKVLYLHDIQVVKDISGIRKINYINNRDALELFNKKFKNDIEGLPVEKREKYNKVQYTFLYLAAQQSGDKNLIKFAAEELARHDKNSNEKIQTTNLKYKLINLSNICCFNNLITLIRNIRYAKKERSLIKYVSHERYEQIISLLKVK